MQNIVIFNCLDPQTAQRKQIHLLIDILLYRAIKINFICFVMERRAVGMNKIDTHIAARS